MDRRSFLKLAAFLPFNLEQTLQGEEQPSFQLTPSTPRSLDHLEVRGTYDQIGYLIGKQFRKNILQIIQRWGVWHMRLLTTMNTRKGKIF